MKPTAAVMLNGIPRTSSAKGGDDEGLPQAAERGEDQREDEHERARYDDGEAGACFAQVFKRATKLEGVALGNLHALFDAREGLVHEALHVASLDADHKAHAALAEFVADGLDGLHRFQIHKLAEWQDADIAHADGLRADGVEVGALRVGQAHDDVAAAVAFEHRAHGFAIERGGDRAVHFGAGDIAAEQFGALHIEHERGSAAVHLQLGVPAGHGLDAVADFASEPLQHVEVRAEDFHRERALAAFEHFVEPRLDGLRELEVVAGNRGVHRLVNRLAQLGFRRRAAWRLWPFLERFVEDVEVVFPEVTRVFSRIGTSEVAIAVMAPSSSFGTNSAPSRKKTSTDAAKSATAPPTVNQRRRSAAASRGV
jgi:hypothetical protein